MNTYSAKSPSPPRRLYRSRRERVLMGVCGGIAEHFGLSPWGVRLIFVLIALFTFISLPVWAVAYVVAGLVVKLEPERPLPGGEAEEFWHLCRDARAAAVRKAARRLGQLERRLQRLETIVTRPGFDLERQVRDL